MVAFYRYIQRWKLLRMINKEVLAKIKYKSTVSTEKLFTIKKL